MLKILNILGSALLTIGLLITALYIKLRYDLEPNLNYPPVTATRPKTSSTHLQIPPYRGPHPSRWQRPADPFDFPIGYGEVGPSMPLFADLSRYPFACMTESTGLGQPVVDNHQGWGIPVYFVDHTGNKTTRRIGYSMDCGLTTQPIVAKRNDHGRYHVSLLLKATTLLDKHQVDAKHPNPWAHGEVGTLNRYLYALLMPSKDYQSALEQSLDAWNGHLIYYFQGGVGIGFQQGSLKIHKVATTLNELLQAGYAIATSTANATSTTYDIWIAEDTLSRVVRQFSHQFTKPKRIIGVGGSGGAIQQYLISQNRPGLLDAGVALYSYPDMVTQIPSVLDCELLEYYCDRLSANPKRWSDWNQRKAIEGMNAAEGFPNRYRWYQPWIEVFNGKLPSMPTGASTCSNSWRGVIDQFNNPRFNTEYRSYSPEVKDSTHWTHWDDLKHLYGTDTHGYAHSLFDNQGVQYGLNALKQNLISVTEFLDLNAKIGGWLPQHRMQNSQYWVLSGEPNVRDLSLWSEFNMTHFGLSQWPAPRSIANPLAVEAAFRSGMVFTGKLRMPVIDLRHYLDDKMDMHYSWASFSTRKRIQRSLGQHKQQVIWMTRKPHLPLLHAVEQLQDWLNRQEANPTGSLAENRPPSLEDRCYTSQGQLIAQGPKVWDGPWNQKPTGPCLAIYPNYSSARQIAGDNLMGLTFICQRISVQEAIVKGVYDPIDLSGYIQDLERIFPDGVCDYQQPGQGFPLDSEAWPH